MLTTFRFRIPAQHSVRAAAAYSSDRSFTTYMAGHAEESASDTALQSEATAATFSRISRNPLSLQPIRPPMSRRTLRDAKSNSQILSLLGWPIQGTLDIHF